MVAVTNSAIKVLNGACLTNCMCLSTSGLDRAQRFPTPSYLAAAVGVSVSIARTKGRPVLDGKRRAGTEDLPPVRFDARAARSARLAAFKRSHNGPNPGVGPPHRRLAASLTTGDSVLTFLRAFGQCSRYHTSSCLRGQPARRNDRDR